MNPIGIWWSKGDHLGLDLHLDVHLFVHESCQASADLRYQEVVAVLPPRHFSRESTTSSRFG